jgi:signal transduction histidine kinase/CheY-like chemotaxis protein
VVHLEDKERDAEQVAAALAQDGMRHTYTRVTTLESLRAHLERGTCDVVLASNAVQGVAEGDAMALVARHGAGVPFIVVMTPTGDHRAVDALWSGAWDVVLKDRLERLGFSLRRTLRGARVRSAPAEEATPTEVSEVTRFLLETSRDAVLRLDAQARVQYANPSASQLFSPDAAQPLGCHVTALAPGPLGERWVEALDHVLHRQAPATLAGFLENREHEPQLEIRLIPVRGGSGAWAMGRLVTAADAEDRAGRPEARSPGPEALQAVEAAVGVVATELRRPVDAAARAARNALATVAADHPARAEVEAAARGAHVALDLLGQLQGFARCQELTPAPVEVTQALRRVADRAGATIQVEMRHGPDVGQVFMDPAQLERALDHVVQNAVEAMPGGGRLVVQTRRIVLAPESQVNGGTLAPGTYVLVAVSDAGRGIPGEIQERVFQPFFTTQEPPHGRGLGLCFVRGFVNQSGGKVVIHSEEGQGTTVQLYLPCQRTGQAPTTNAPPVAPAAGTERVVLVVDDDDACRRAMVRLLRCGGFVVLEAASAETALEVFRSQPGRVGAVVTDFSLPGKNGVDLAKDLRVLRPGLRVLMCSGYGEAAPELKQVEPGTLEVLAKPFESAEFKARVASLFGPEGGSPT